METTVNELNFVWDDRKAKSNKIKHGVSFSTATKVFFDKNRIERFDAEHSEYEDRWQVIGMAGDVLFVVYTERSEKIRLISARAANDEERKIYYGRLLHS